MGGGGGTVSSGRKREENYESHETHERREEGCWFSVFVFKGRGENSEKRGIRERRPGSDLELEE